MQWCFFLPWQVKLFSKESLTFLRADGALRIQHPIDCAWRLSLATAGAEAPARNQPLNAAQRSGRLPFGMSSLIVQPAPSNSDARRKKRSKPGTAKSAEPEMEGPDMDEAVAAALGIDADVEGSPEQPLPRQHLHHLI